jgi:integrase
MQVLPTFQQNFVKKKERASDPGWTPFNEGDLKRIFAPANYVRLVKPHEFWFPLIALFTGARREEIAQLTLDDIREEQGAWIIDINDRDFKSVKTRAGVRVIPLHPALVAVGFLNYLDDVRAVAPNVKRIFPYLRFDSSNGFGDVPGEAFARYLDSLGIRDADKVLHSFRKNANNRLMDNGVEEVLRCRMVGHSYDSVNVTKYTTGVTIKMLTMLVIPKLTFPEIDVLALERKAGFRDVLANEIAAAAKRRAAVTRRRERQSRAGSEAVPAKGRSGSGRK